MECDCEDELLERDREIEMLSDEAESWRARAERAEAERDALDEAFDRDLPWRYDEAIDRLKRAEGAIERVRALHRKETRRSGWEVCTHCEVGMLQDPVDWPCDTIAALDAELSEKDQQ